MGRELDYLFVLRALQDIPFGVGKKLLVDFLQGNEVETIRRHRLQNKPTFGSLAYEKEDIEGMVDSLLVNGLLQQVSVNNSFWKVLELTERGRQELEDPQLHKRKIKASLRDIKTTITDDDRKLFGALGDFLKNYNDDQKKAIVCGTQNILCLAGAGSGKTAVLTKRIEFLSNYRTIEPKKILAITFTRKARREMMARLEKIGGLEEVQVETFNSFCERILRLHADIIYGRNVRVISFKDRFLIMQKALIHVNVSMRQAIDIYFSNQAKRGKTDEQLANILMGDCFFIRDYFTVKSKPIEEKEFIIGDEREAASAGLVFRVCRFIDSYLKAEGLRDFADQLMDAIALFKNHPDLIPQADHVLIDEYQDVNATQMELVSLLHPKNIFCVGDPRQAIYGWRGSDVRFILGFEEKFPGAEIITLSTNYRSTRHIVGLANEAAKSMGLPNLASAIEGEKDIRLLHFETEDAEYEFVIQRILAAETPRSEIFVLARTNRQLADLSALLTQRQIPHIVRSDEIRRSVEAKEGDVTLATIHAIKGLEAEMVFVIGCSAQYFPCKGSEHPIVEMVKVEEYDKEEEERRLLYVALSRAKKSLYISNTGKRSSFITNQMEKLIEDSDEGKGSAVFERLREWRRQKSADSRVPPFMILHDRTLIDLAAKKPLTLAELEDVHGMGPMKIVKFGEELLDVLNSTGK